MKNRSVLLFLFTFIALFLLYRFDYSVAMANAWFGADHILQLETGQSAQPKQAAQARLSIQAGQSTQAATGQQPDYVSSGAELMQWLEAHKRTGGIVRLTDNIVLDGFQGFGHDRINLPSIYVDTGRYTITVTGEADFLSDNHLIFRGQGNTNGILRVSKGGMLTLNGITITVQGTQGKAVPSYVLWQEEGAGLVVDNCEVSGNIRYADMPFVIHDNSVSVIVEKGQTAGNVLPSAIKGDINYHGGVTYNELLPVTWNLTGTKKYQEQRKRFNIQGSFSHVAFMEPPVCTVVYNDYPLTFTEIKTQASESGCIFKMWYTKPEEYLPIVVSAQYSFDGKEWVTYDEYTASETQDSVFIGLTSEQWDTADHPYVYLRLEWDHEGTPYYSNVLRFSAENLKNGEDQGGTRGGGTSIVNPPDKPQKEENPPSETGKTPGTKPGGSTGNENNPHTSDNHEDKNTPDVKPADNGGMANENNPSYTEPSDNGTEEQPPEETGAPAAGASGVSAAGGSEISSGSVNETPADSAGEALGEDAAGDAEELDSESSVETVTLGDGENVSEEQTSKADPNAGQNRNIVLALSFAALFIIAGGAAFCFRTGIFGRRFRKIKRNY